MQLSNDVIETLKAEHDGELYLVEAAGASIIVKAPTRPQYRRFIEAAGLDKKRPAAMENLARDCVVFPDAKAFNDLLEQKPGIASTLTSKLLEFAGVVEDAEAKKL